MSRILAIDDDRATLHLLREAFRGTKLDVETAATAAEGLKLIADRRPHVVLLDVMLPDLSGIEAFEKIKQLDRRLPVIFITASGTSDTGSGAGGNGPEPDPGVGAMSLDFVRSGTRVVALGYSSNEERVYRTYHYQALGFDCNFVPDAEGQSQR